MNIPYVMGTPLVAVLSHFDLDSGKRRADGFLERLVVLPGGDRMPPRESQYHQRFGDIGLFLMVTVLGQSDTAMHKVRVSIGDGGHPRLDLFFPTRGHCDVPAVDSNVHNHRPPKKVLKTIRVTRVTYATA